MICFFGGSDYYEPHLPRDATQVRRFRRLLGGDGIEQLFKANFELGGPADPR